MLRERGRQLARAWLGLHVAIVASVFGYLLLRPEFQREIVLTNQAAIKLWSIGAFVVVGWPLLLRYFRIHDSQRRVGMLSQLRSLFLADLIGTACLSAVAFVMNAPISPLLPLAMGGVLFLVQAGVQIPAFYALHTLRRSGRNYRSILIIGAGPRAARALDAIDRHPEWGYRVLGFVDDGASDFTPKVPQDLIYKHVDVPHLLTSETVDEVLVACPRSMLGSLASIVGECMTVGVPVTMLTDLFGDHLPRPEVGSFGHMSTLSFAPVHHGELELQAKRGLDILGAAVGLALTAPILLVSAIAIKLTSPGPVFFRQIRLGMNGRPFEMIKLRTMVVDAEARKAELLHLNEMDGPVFKMKADPRATPLGRILRKWSVDELPQFWNVLKGDMSIVGPRPPTPDEVLQYRACDRRRLSMRPGLTCLWQISGRNQMRFEEWMELDLQYIDQWSLANDLRIIALTVPEVIRARGAS